MRLNKICFLMCFLMSCLWFSSFPLWDFHGNFIFFNVVGRESKPAHTVKFLFNEVFLCISSCRVILKLSNPSVPGCRGEGDKTVPGVGLPLASVTPPAPPSPFASLCQSALTPACQEHAAHKHPFSCTRACDERSAGWLRCLWCFPGEGGGWDGCWQWQGRVGRLQRS